MIHHLGISNFRTKHILSNMKFAKKCETSDTYIRVSFEIERFSKINQKHVKSLITYEIPIKVAEQLGY